MKTFTTKVRHGGVVTIYCGNKPVEVLKFQYSADADEWQGFIYEDKEYDLNYYVDGGVNVAIYPVINGNTDTSHNLKTI